MKIYTKKGDQGFTSMYGGGRVAKSNPIIEVIGSLDECNCSLGVALASCSEEEIKKQLCVAQHILFDLGSVVSYLGSNAYSKGVTGLKPSVDFVQATQRCEEWIDSMQEQLPALTQFILPGGGVLAAHLHLSRAYCRNTERRFTAQELLLKECPEGAAWLNRLSDYLFVLARYANFLEREEEQVWNKQILAQT